MRQCLKYLKGTIVLKLTITAYDLSVVKFWVGASYVIHNDCKGHTVAVMTLGKGNVTSFSIKQKIQGKSSTEDKLVVSDDAVSKSLWTKYFLGYQRYTSEENIMYQDKKSAILLEKNGKISRSKRIKYIKVRFLFIKYFIALGGLSVD